MHASGLEHILAEYWGKWMTRGRKAHARKEGAVWILSRTRRARASMVLICLLFSVFYTYVFFVDGHVFDDTPAWKRIPLEVGSFFLWGLAVYGAASALLERLTVSDLGVSRRSVFRVRHMSWASLVRVDVAKHGDGVKLIGKDGQVLPVSPDMDGLPMLLAYLDRYAAGSEAAKARIAFSGVGA